MSALTTRPRTFDAPPDCWDEVVAIHFLENNQMNLVWKKGLPDGTHKDVVVAVSATLAADIFARTGIKNMINAVTDDTHPRL